MQTGSFVEGIIAGVKFQTFMRMVGVESDSDMEQLDDKTTTL